MYINIYKLFIIFIKLITVIELTKTSFPATIVGMLSFYTFVGF